MKLLEIIFHVIAIYFIQENILRFIETSLIMKKMLILCNQGFVNFCQLAGMSLRFGWKIIKYHYTYWSDRYAPFLYILINILFSSPCRWYYKQILFSYFHSYWNRWKYSVFSGRYAAHVSNLSRVLEKTKKGT